VGVVPEKEDGGRLNNDHGVAVCRGGVEEEAKGKERGGGEFP